MAEPDDAGAESAAVQAFIAQRQADILDRAVTTLRECPDDELAGQAHRLAGTLGTYQLTHAQALFRSLELAVNAPGVTQNDIDRARADTLAALHGRAGDDDATTGGMSSP